MRTLMLSLTAALITTALAGPTLSQSPGANGGQTTVADGHPVEFVSTDRELVFFLNGEDGKPLDTQGLSARAFVQASGKSTTVTLAPAAPNKLVGPLAAPLGKGAKVVLSAKVHGHSLQARFEK